MFVGDESGKKIGMEEKDVEIPEIRPVGRGRQLNLDDF